MNEHGEYFRVRNTGLLHYLLILLFLMAITAVREGNASAAPVVIGNPDWEITITDHGYSDLLFDKRPGFEGREYLSGEWAAALRYDQWTPRAGDPFASVWLEPTFVAPDWGTNSDFGVTTPVTDTGADNADGFDIFTSVIANPHLEVTMTYQMLDSVAGIEMGATPKSAAGPPGSITSDRYIFSQKYEIRNISGAPVTGLQIFQFLHGLNSQMAVIDDRDYGGPYGEYKYDVFERGLSITPDSDGQLFEHDDILAYHASLEPTAWEAGHYGKEPPDNHSVGKPSIGVHLSVESDTLSGTDLFDPGALWIGGAQRFGLGDLLEDDSVSFDVLLSIHTDTTAVPIPSSILLFATALIGLTAAGSRNRRAM